MLAGPGDWTNVLYHALADRFDIVALIVETPMTRSTLLQRRAARVGWPRVLDQAAFSVLVVPVLRALARNRLRELRMRLGADERIPEELVVHVPSINAAATVDALQQRSPRVVVVSGTRIIDSTIIASVDAPFVNMHAGITPRYRGVHGAYWALAEGRPSSAGVTVHLVDEGIDTGAILGQARIDAGPDDSFVTYPYLQLEAGIPILIGAIEAALDGRPASVASADASASTLRYHPGLIGYLARRLSRGIR